MHTFILNSITLEVVLTAEFPLGRYHASFQMFYFLQIRNFFELATYLYSDNIHYHLEYVLVKFPEFTTYFHTPIFPDFVATLILYKTKKKLYSLIIVQQGFSIQFLNIFSLNLNIQVLSATFNIKLNL